MKNVIVIYWSGTGNTEAMAQAVAQGAANAETQVKLFDVKDAKVEDVIDADAIALGCPSMGSEQLEEDEMEPFVQSISDKVRGKKVALFGSYGWGNGEWMIDWQERMITCGVKLVSEGLTINNAPDDAGLQECSKLGELLVK